MADVLAVLNTLAQLALAAGVVYNIYQNVLVANNVQKIEVATNSMKDALVAATQKSAHLEGREEQRAETKAEEKLL